MKKSGHSHSEERSGHPEAPKPTPSRLLKGALWTGAVVLGLWGLMYVSAPKSNLEPYTKFQNASLEKETPAKETSKPAAPAETAASEAPSPSRDENVHAANEALRDPARIKTVASKSGMASLPRETLEHIQRGMDLTEKGEYNGGDQEFKKAAEISPNSPEVFAIWATALKMAKKFPVANKKFQRALELSPKDPEILFNWGLSRLEENANPEAAQLLEQTIEIQPDNAIAYNFLGKAYGRQKLYDKEEAAYRKALELQPEFAQAYFNLGLVLAIQKKFEQAAPYFEKAIAMDPYFEQPFVVQMLTALGRYTPSKDKMAQLQEAEDKKAQEKGKEEKAADKTEGESKETEGSHEGSSEGSGKKVKDTTSIKGHVRINGQPAPPNALVMLETKTKMRVPGETLTNITIKQSDLKFFPQHSVVVVGSHITFTNEDREVHNIFSKSINNQFNLGAMAGGTSKTITFENPGPVVLRCNMHKDMIGTVFVVPNGYFTNVDGQGNYTFNNISSNNYILQVWHPSLLPEEVEAHLKSADLTGVDQTFDFDIASKSNIGEIHDMVEAVDYNLVVDNIEKEMFLAIADWSEGKHFISRKRMLMAITKHFAGGGLKGAIAKSFSEKRSKNLEDQLDEIRKKISGIGYDPGKITRPELESEARLAVSQLRNSVKELETRLNPDFNKSAN
ncbi:MAG: hypothetical protein COV67_10075 [Nitrospinae bacterium CG11_big_fil_rev_8_21_14_0_20_56_8]|nr:MAG: hypothetical protein COV67_10075 [Nitrospinae bacterium CG11_big_fil_rev_8_21_14_0_20_56_8]